MTKSIPTEQEMLKITRNSQMDEMGFLCIDQLGDINGDDTEDPNVWVWQRADGFRVAMYDDGNDMCSFVRFLNIAKGFGPKKHIRPKDLVLA